jgi:hypothetical protein
MPTLFAFVRLRYSLGGDRPSQTNFHKLSAVQVSKIKSKGWYCTGAFYIRAPTYSKQCFLKIQLKIIVKVHRVFPSSCKKAASSRLFQIHQGHVGDSREVVTPFMQDGTYPPRNFATFGPLELQPPFTGH